VKAQRASGRERLDSLTNNVMRSWGSATLRGPGQPDRACSIAGRTKHSTSTPNMTAQARSSTVAEAARSLSQHDSRGRSTASGP
jgi:hypothetical protein